MVGAQSRARRRLAARFSRPEVRHMEMLLREGKDELSDPKFHQKLADEFNAKDRAEKKAIQAQQIQRWFLNRQHIEKIEDISSSSSSKEMDPAGDENMPNNAVQCFDFPEDDCDEISEGFVMEFEAKSYRDQAWRKMKLLTTLMRTLFRLSEEFMIIGFVAAPSWYDMFMIRLRRLFNSANYAVDHDISMLANYAVDLDVSNHGL
ncbi:uncharacterized protein LOC110035693 isoform X2 [Phalaenopsis equestris]|uniref:uncharacterized protein LOC110035693 isoform X2 n=1 Tax=Phalaenopsis equestris TaxID=78828 RepID=UPI0009E4BEAC|nr:uncharacterized protein LOC110035693 isoform X2 [Phalaenopsis equestris]